MTAQNQNPKDFLKFLRRHQPAFDELLQECVSMDTPSGDAEAVNRFQDRMQQVFGELIPDEVSRIRTPAGDILAFDFFKGRTETVVWLAHVDTAKVSEKSLPVRIKKNKLYGSGALDMKSAILLFYFSILAYRKLDMRPSHAVRILLTPDEETGSNASTPYLLKTCKTAKAVILPEICCPDGGVKTQRKGVLTLKARLNGKAAHSGIDPEKGIDANRAVAKLILRIEHILADHPGIRFNPGLITGGTATNIVSPEAILEGELRAYSTHALLQAAEKLKTVDEIDGVTVNFRTELTHPALEFTPANRGLYEKAKAIADAMNYPLPTCSTGGSSDGSKLSAAGIPVIDGLGMRGAGAHSTQEYVELPDFPYRAALVSALTLEI